MGARNELTRGRGVRRRSWALLAAGVALAAAGVALPVLEDAPLLAAPLGSHVPVQATERGPAEPVPGGCRPPVRVDVRGPGASYEWWAEPELEPLVRRLAAHEPAYAPMPGIGPLESAPGTRIYLLRDLACLAALGLSSPGVDWVAGVASWGERYAAVRAGGPGDGLPALRSVLRHELAHLALARATEGRAPRWLQEGYAQLAAGDWDWEEAWRLRWAFVRGGGSTLEGLSLRLPADPEGARLAYQLSYTAVQEILSLSGERGLRAFIAALGQGATTDEAFRRVFALTEGQFEDRWRSAVAGRYGILYTLSRAAFFWIAVSLLVAWVAIRRKRRNRERLEAMREAEAREGEGPEWRALLPWR